MNNFTDDYKLDILVVEEGLSKWEKDFIDSLRERLEEGKELTERQKEVLDELFLRYA